MGGTPMPLSKPIGLDWFNHQYARSSHGKDSAIRARDLPCFRRPVAFDDIAGHSSQIAENNLDAAARFLDAV